MKSAIIGLGMIGSVHTKVLRELFGEPYAVCDVIEEKFSEYPNSLHYTDYKAMLDEARPDVVHICTPHYLHAEMIIECLKRDINVLCEKPLCISKAEINAVLEAEKKSSAKLGICMQNRYNAPNVYVKDYLSDKQIISATGNVVWHRGEKYYNSAAWRGKWATEGGGVLINQALHTLDLMQWINGMPEYVTASVSNLTLDGIIEVEDTAVALYSGNSEFSFFATVGSNKDFNVEMTIRTADETIKVFTNSVMINEKIISFDKDDSVYGKLCYGSGHKRLVEDFYDCIATGKDFEINGEEASKVVRLILGVYASQGKKVLL